MHERGRMGGYCNVAKSKYTQMGHVIINRTLEKLHIANRWYLLQLRLTILEGNEVSQ